MFLIKIISILVFFTSAALAADKSVVVSVKGMVCSFCAQGVTKKFKAEPSISNVDVSLEKKIVTLTLKDGQDLTDEKISSLLKDSGFNVEKINRDTK